MSRGNKNIIKYLIMVYNYKLCSKKEDAKMFT